MTMWECREEHDNPTSSWWRQAINANFLAHSYNSASLPIGCSTYNYDTTSLHMMYYETSDTVQPDAISTWFPAVCKRCARNPSNPVPPCEYYHASALATSAAGACPAGHEITTNDECLAYERHLHRLKDAGKVEHPVDTHVQEYYDNPRTNVAGYPTGCSWMRSGTKWVINYEASDSVNGPYYTGNGQYYLVCKTPGACPVQPPPSPPPPSAPPPASPSPSPPLPPQAPPPCAPDGYEVKSSAANTDEGLCDEASKLTTSECQAFSAWLQEDPTRLTVPEGTDHSGKTSNYATSVSTTALAVGCNVHVNYHAIQFVRYRQLSLIHI